MIKRAVPTVFFFVLVFLVSVAFVGLIQEFIMAGFWAVVLALVFQSPYRRLFSWSGDRANVAAILATLSVLVLVVVPLTLVSLALVYEGTHLYDVASAGGFDVGREVDKLQHNPLFQSLLDRFGLEVSEVKRFLQTRLAGPLQKLGTYALGLGQNLVSLGIQFIVMLYLLFFCFRDGDELVELFIKVIPIGDAKERRLFERFASVARATVRGSLLIAVLQGTAGGILFYALGIPGSVVFGALMILASLMPVGAAVVWGPAALILLLQGRIWDAVIMVVVGSLLIGTADNVLRPKLVGQDTKLPDYIILLSTLGGITQFGLSGFVMGPVVAALFVSIWKMVGDEFSDPLEAKPVQHVKKKWFRKSAVVEVEVDKEAEALAKTSELKASDAKATDAKASDAKVTEAKAPEAEVSEAKAPEAKASEIVESEDKASPEDES